MYASLLLNVGVLSSQFLIVSRSAGMTQKDRSQLGIQALQKSFEHFLYLKKFEFGRLMPADVDHPQIPGEQQEIFELTCGTHGNVEELPQFGAPLAAAAFCNVCGDRRCCPPDLAAQPKPLIGRKVARNSVGVERQSMATTPNLKLVKVLQGSPLRHALSAAANYLQLNTNNCQLVSRGCHAG